MGFFNKSIFEIEKAKTNKSVINPLKILLLVFEIEKAKTNKSVINPLKILKTEFFNKSIFEI